jgi:hypothetical protein
VSAAPRPSGHADFAPAVLGVEPADGATGVFRDVPILVRLSHPADPRSVTLATVQVEERGRGPLPGRIVLSPDGALLIWTADRELAAGVEHLVFACGLRDRLGRELPPHRSRFVPCDLTFESLLTLEGTGD